MGTPLEIVRGTTNTFILTVTDHNGGLYELEEGQVLVFGVKQGKTDVERALVKKIRNTVDGEYYLELTPEDTANLEPGRYFYDVGLQNGNSVFFSVIPASPLILLPNMTQLGDGA